MFFYYCFRVLHGIYFYFILEKSLPSVETCLNIDRSHQDSGSIWDHSRTVATSGVTPGQWQHLGSLQDSGRIWDHSRTVAASGITPGQWQNLGSLLDSGSIWDHSSTAATSYVCDHCMCVLLSGNSGYLIWGSSCRTNTKIFL